MRIRGVRSFRKDVTQLLREDEPVLVLRRGKPAGVLYPTPNGVLPRDIQELLSKQPESRVTRGHRRGHIEQLQLIGPDLEATA
ncbi:MAG: hypothetical protein HW416_1086 [Chloroflexi bacterium]|nr:hypothetical protein [Chloroflexota bacterium]